MEDVISSRLHAHCRSRCRSTGSYFVTLRTRQGHQVTCGDRDPERARRFLGSKRPVTVERVNARNLRSIVKAVRGTQLWATARMAALFIKHFPRELTGVHVPEALPREVRRAILRDVRARGCCLVKRVTVRDS